jgi:chaperonin GroEL (HSP60 family)
VRRAYLYAGDLFKPLDLSWGELVELAEKPETVLERFKREIEGLAGPVRSLKLRKAVVAGGGEAVIEYVAELAGARASGEASVKIVYAENPMKALREFYERERKTA